MSTLLDPEYHLYVGTVQISFTIKIGGSAPNREKAIRDIEESAKDYVRSKIHSQPSALNALVVGIVERSGE
jgi:hypothetical protein